MSPFIYYAALQSASRPYSFSADICSASKVRLSFTRKCPTVFPGVRPVQCKCPSDSARLLLFALAFRGVDEDYEGAINKRFAKPFVKGGKGDADSH